MKFKKIICFFVIVVICGCSASKSSGNNNDANWSDSITGDFTDILYDIGESPTDHFMPGSLKIRNTGEENLKYFNTLAESIKDIHSTPFKDYSDVESLSKVIETYKLRNGYTVSIIISKNKNGVEMIGALQYIIKDKRISEITGVTDFINFRNNYTYIFCDILLLSSPNLINIDDSPKNNFNNIVVTNNKVFLDKYYIINGVKGQTKKTVINNEKYSIVKYNFKK